MMLLRGKHLVSPGLSLLSSAAESEIVRVLGSDVTKLEDLTRVQARKAGSAVSRRCDAGGEDPSRFRRSRARDPGIR